MLDIHIGVTDTQIAERALKSIADVEWIKIYQINDAENLYDLRKRGYASGVSPWVTFLDQDDEMISSSQLLPVIKGSGVKPFFANSQIVTDKGSRFMFPRNYVWKGTNSYLNGEIPHNPFFMRKEMALQAIDSAYQRILRTDESFLDSVDLAVAFEIHLKHGWTYVDKTMYRWYNDTGTGNHHTNEAYPEVARYYLNLLK